jgi:diketogulonate reductase-like aldo/keto reductase
MRPQFKVRRAGAAEGDPMRSVVLPSGERVPALGMGTWKMAEKPALRAQEIATLRLGLDRGLTLIDTAEMYGEGRAEELIAEVLTDRRDEVFIVSKVYPHNATHSGVPQACERSLRRLRTDRIDMYLLHWRGNVPFEETMEAFAALQRAGKIRHYGVSNLDLSDLREVFEFQPGRVIQTDQLLYNLTRRGLEWDLLPWLRKHRIPVMAYSPIEEGRLARHRQLQEFAQRHGMSPAQVALSWLLAHDDIVAIPKTSRPERLLENLAALEKPLDTQALAELNRLFPPPEGPRHLEMI